jgi:hypothetical protein
VTFFKRMFSADFRRAVAAEAAGDYSEAARAYALAGEHAKVAEMHLLRAERAASPEGSLQELRAAVRWADPEEPDGRAVRRRIARALFMWAKKAGIVSDGDRQVVKEAASLFAEAGDHSGAGECLEFIGDEMAAAEAYQRAGDLERLEAVLHREEARRKKAHRVTDSYEEYRLHLAGGERDLALSALRLCVEESADDQAGYRRQLEQLEARMLTDGSVSFRSEGHEIQYAGVFPLVIGREATCHIPMRDAGISRRHCEVIVAADGRLAIKDLASKNGTTLAGLPLAPGGVLPLEGAGEIGVGEHCTLGFQLRDGRLELEVKRGLDRGRVIVASPGAIDLAPRLHVPAQLAFTDGRPRLTVREGALHLNGVHAGGAIQLLRGDHLQVGAVRFEVL